MRIYLVELAKRIQLISKGPKYTRYKQEFGLISGERAKIRTYCEKHTIAR